jgi:hypothetical protein
MLQEFVDNEFSISVWARIGLCAWIGTVMSLYVILFWPPYLSRLVQGLGIMDLLQQLQTWIKPFFTAGYLS